MTFERPYAVIERDADGYEHVVSWWSNEDDAESERNWQAQRFARPLGWPRYAVKDMRTGELVDA